MKPILAVDAPLNNLESLTYPRAALIKYDGVRVICNGEFTGRSLKLHKNPVLQQRFKRPDFFGFDCEGIGGYTTDMQPVTENHPLLCSITSGAFSRRSNDKKEPHKLVDVPAYLIVFDDFSAEGGWLERYNQAAERVKALHDNDPNVPVRMAPYWVVYNAEELLEFENCCLNGGTFKSVYIPGGYEGVITRSLDGEYKHGRTTEKEATYLRMKRFEEREGLVIRLEEGFTNKNKPIKNKLGQIERGTSKEGMIPNGMIGAMILRDLASNEEVRVAAGCMTDAEAKHYFENPHEIVDKLISKYKHFAHGQKDAVRFATHQSFRSKEDMS